MLRNRDTDNYQLRYDAKYQNKMNSVDYDFLVVGTGFKAAYCALKLRESFKKSKIAIFSKFFGGVYSSFQAGPFSLDIGCHLYDINNKKLIETFDIDENTIVPVDTNYGSINNYGLTEGYILNDFRNFPNVSELQENFLENFNLQNSAIEQKRFFSLEEEFKKRFGGKISKEINNFCKKITGFESSNIDKRSAAIFFYSRLLLYDNETSLKMKANGFDDLLAANTKSVHDYSKGYVSFTFKNGNYGFLNQMQNVLKKKGIKIVSVEPSAKIVLNVNAAEKRFERIKTPLHLVYFKCRQFPYTYLHDFSDSPIFRISSPGHYANQYKDRESYICLEIPDPLNKYSKAQIVPLAKKYSEQFCKPEFLFYQSVKNSYPVYKVSEKNIEPNEFDIFLYGKGQIIENVDEYLGDFGTEGLNF